MPIRSCLRRSPYLRFGLAALLPVLALLLHLGLVAVYGPDEDPGTYQFFLAAVGLSAVWGGRPSGLVTLTLAVLLEFFFFLPPRLSFTIDKSSTVVHLFLFAGVGFLFARVGGNLWESEERFSTALASIGDGVIATDEKRVVSFMNPVAESLSGWEADSAKGRDIEEVLQLVDERGERQIDNPVEMAIQRGSVVRLPGDARLVSRNGTSVAIEDSAAPIRGGSGHPRGAIMVFRDVTTQRTAQKAVRDSEARYRFLADAVPEFIFTAKAGECDYFNRRWYAYTGLTEEQSFGRAWISAIHPEDVTTVLSNWASSLESAREFELECRVAGRDGTYRTFLMRGLPMQDETSSVPRLFGVLIDVEERKANERRLRQSGRMEAIGQLAGGVAHDFNNLLTIICGYAEILHDKSSPGSEQRIQLDQICRAADQAAALTKQLLTFSRGKVLRSDVLDVNEVVQDTERLLRRLIRENIVFETRLAPGPLLAGIDYDQLVQVIMNLAVNAQDAMPQGGHITIETARVLLDESYRSTHSEVRTGSYSLLTVSDTGAGMDQEIQARAFEPFFTTKQPGRGTGLGLSTVYGVVNRAQGHVWLYSEPGHGTTVKVYLPAAEGTEVTRHLPDTGVTDLSGHETILVVEDEEHIRNLVHAVLTRLGYTVLRAAGPEQALHFAETSSDPIDLLVTDMVMPGMSGQRVAREIAQRRPGLKKVIFMSGYAEDAILPQEDLPFQFDFIQKPFTGNLLALVVRKSLDRAKGA